MLIYVVVVVVVVVHWLSRSLCRCRKLIELLKAPTTSPQVLEIALNDIGEYVRYYPRGKK